MPASHCGGVSCCRARGLGTRTSVVVARGLSHCGSRALERRLSGCGSWVLLLCSMWDRPGPRLEPVSPALAGGFLTTVPPRKSQQVINFLLVEGVSSVLVAADGSGWGLLKAGVAVAVS